MSRYYAARPPGAPCRVGQSPGISGQAHLRPTAGAEADIEFNGTPTLRLSPRSFARFIGEPRNATLNSSGLMRNSSRASGRASVPGARLTPGER